MCETTKMKLYFSAGLYPNIDIDTDLRDNDPQCTIYIYTHD